MIQVAIAAGLVLICTAGSIPALAAQTDTPKNDPTILPTGTRIELAVTAPVWMRTAKAGGAIYTQVDFPVIAGNSIAIPAGTYAEGTILSITRPSHFKNRAEIQALFTTLIFANGYAVQLPAIPSVAGSNQDAAGNVAVFPAPSIMKLILDVSASNDLLLDNGTQFNLMLASPLALDSRQIGVADRVSRSFDFDRIRSATLCRPTPGTPGTPGSSDTVIPGIPSTPSTVIPGAPGQPDIVIPGTPGTPDTVIPGSPGTPGAPGQSCPGAPIVVSSELVSIPQPQNATTTSPSNP